MKNKSTTTTATLPPRANANDIYIKNANVHNLKNVTVSLPRNKLIVVTGVSGSGKSSLTIDTLFAEGQRRYAESLSAYARQFMQRMNKPDVEYIKGLCPAIAIEQKVITRTPRSTVGSMTEIYDYLRLLYARIGKTISPISKNVVKKDDVADVLNAIEQLQNGDKVLMLVPFKQQKKREIKEELHILLQKGFTRIYIHETEDGKNKKAGAKVEKIKPKNEKPIPETTSGILRIEELLELGDKELNKKLDAGILPLTSPLSRHATPSIFVLIDRIVVKSFDEDEKHRISDSANTAFYEGEGSLVLEINGKKKLHFSNRFELDGLQFEEPVPNLFSFNNPYGACPTCEGFSQILGIDENLVIPNKQLSLYEDAIAPWKGEKLSAWKDQFIKGAKNNNFPIHKAIIDLSKEQWQLLWQGNEQVRGINDFFKEVEQNLYKVQYRVLLSRYRGKTICTDCNGYRLRKEALYVKVNEMHIGQLCEMPVKYLQQWFGQLKLSAYENQVAKRILLEINHRIKTLMDVGLGYLTLNRLANSLSGGESQRIQLTRSLGSNLTNSLYILDEPSIGLHSRDTEKLITVLKELRNLGNTVIVVEHDEQMMREADYIIDMGPLASHLGGEVIAYGNYDAIIKNKESLTGKYLSGNLKIEPPKQVRKWNKSITIKGARQNNLQNIDVTFPLQVLCTVSGVSGSGKTTLVKQILYPALKKLKGGIVEKAGIFKTLSGDVDAITQIEMIDQNPIGKSSRSNPVTYIKAYDEIRDLFSKLPLSKMRGFMPKHFSFNVDGGRCDACKGEGEQVVEMQFLADVHLVCDVCHGKRFKEEVLEVTYKEKNIFDVLEMSVDEAIDFFSSSPEGKNKDGAGVAQKIQPLSDVGLGYIKLGQSSDTLSGGEAQRVKLASFLGKPTTFGKILFIFDEPTTGLHFHDIKKLLGSFNALINQGHSIIVIEHNTDVIKSADWAIDLGPEAGDGGGNLVFAGTPTELKKCKESYTAKFL